MSILVVVTDPALARPLISLTLPFINAKERKLTVLCWTHLPIASDQITDGRQDLDDGESLVRETRQALLEITESSKGVLSPESVAIKHVVDSDLTNATLAEIRAGHYHLVIADASTATESHPLLRRSPCETVLIYRMPVSSKCVTKILVVASDSPHDQAAFNAFSHSAKADRLRITFARIEDESGAEASELGRRELKRLMRSVGTKVHRSVKRLVYASDASPELLNNAEENHLVLVGANQEQLVTKLRTGTSKPAIAVIKRAPPLVRLTKTGNGRWKTKLSPADYADMMQGLRRGADLNADYIIMLGLAAAIASIGLLQDSPAVVIGSMLLAPLMTPMIGCGLAIAQANKRLGRRSMLAIAVGFMLTLVVSFLLGAFAPGEELTTEVIARGDPNILDLLVALFSAAAAAYALARPNIIGAIAGVAISTALVPPLCSAGVSLAYGDTLNAYGAGLLFATNLVAIILGAAVTFRLLGVTFANADTAQRIWVYRISTVICMSLIVLAFPLQYRLEHRIDQGRAQPRTYPLTKATQHSLTDFVQRSPEIQLVTSGRPSNSSDGTDVVLVLSSPRPLPRDYSEQLVEICRQEMGTPDLEVEVHCFLNAWETAEDSIAPLERTTSRGEAIGE